MHPLQHFIYLFIYNIYLINNSTKPRQLCVLIMADQFHGSLQSLCAGLPQQHIRKEGETTPSKIIYRDRKKAEKVSLNSNLIWGFYINYL